MNTELTPDQLAHAKLWNDLREKYPGETTEQILAHLKHSEAKKIVEETERVLKQRPHKSKKEKHEN